MKKINWYNVGLFLTTLSGTTLATHSQSAFPKSVTVGASITGAIGTGLIYLFKPQAQ